MVPSKAIVWFLASRWEQGLAVLEAADTVIVIGYSFPTHGSAARYGIHMTLSGRTDVKALNVGPKAADPTHRRTVTAIRGRNVEFISAGWCYRCSPPPEPTLAWQELSRSRAPTSVRANPQLLMHLPGRPPLGS